MDRLGEGPAGSAGPFRSDGAERAVMALAWVRGMQGLAARDLGGSAMGLSISGVSGSYDAYHLQQHRGAGRPGRSGEPPAPGASSDSGDARAADASKAKGPGGKPLSEADRKQVEELKQRDRAVRAHEQAHMAAGGALVRGGATFDFQAGPDGQRYAVGGEVSIDTSRGRTPEETIARAQAIKSAALAPADPSAADRAVAAKAAKLEAEARQEMRAATPESKSASGEVAGDGNEQAKTRTPERSSAEIQHARQTEVRPDGRIMQGIAAYQAANEITPRIAPTVARFELMA